MQFVLLLAYENEESSMQIRWKLGDGRIIWLIWQSEQAVFYMRLEFQNHIEGDVPLR